MIADVRANGAGQRYLIEHSAGSGKTETITWTAHELADVRQDNGERLFSSVVVVTDRLSLDTNIKKTIGQLRNAPGYVMDIGTDSEGRRTSGEIPFRSGPSFVGFAHPRRLRRHHRRGPLLTGRQQRRGAEERVQRGGGQAQPSRGAAPALRDRRGGRPDRRGRDFRVLHPHAGWQRDAAERVVLRVHRDPEGRDHDPVRPSRRQARQEGQEHPGIVPQVPDAASHRGRVHHRPAVRVHALFDRVQARRGVRARQTRRRERRAPRHREVEGVASDERDGPR